MQVTRWYMGAYDLLLLVGWAGVSLWMLMRIGEVGISYLAGAWAELETAMIVLQALVLFDVIHGLLGMWGPSEVPLVKRIYCKVGRRSELFLTLILLSLALPARETVLGRLLGIMLGGSEDDGGRFGPHAQEAAAAALSHWSLGSTILFWAMTDVIRYPFYTCSAFGCKPWAVVWMRYSVFLVQYPGCLVSELFFVLVASIALVQIGFVPIWDQPIAWNVLGREVVNGQVMLFSYALLALRNQYRNLVVFVPHFKLLLKVREKHLRGRGMLGG